MATFCMVTSEEAAALGLTGTLVDEQELAAARASAPDVEVEGGVARKPRRARRPAGGDDAGQFVPDDPATPLVNEAYEE